ncbi:MAG: alpha/beta fold hydrolase [Planctomycetes bacterium]|nr:alpha/beta fold hydrolase [Planctomycetota bacterium]
MTLPFAERMSGHAWTVLPTARDLVLRPHLAAFFEHTIPVVDDRFGPGTLSCALAVPDGATDVVVLVHGLGGDRRSPRVQRAARELHELGMATLALDLRGADRRGVGLHHVAMVDDLVAACRSPLLAPFRRVFVLGFSMGGHLALQFAAVGGQPRLSGVAAVCAPLDLAAAQRHLDQPTLGFYRHWVLRGLKAQYAAVARHHVVPTPVAEVRRVRTFHDWDRLVMVPRFGFASVADYHARCSARTVLPRLGVESVLVLAQNDPVVPPELALPWVGEARPGRLRVCVVGRGGHLEIPRGVDLGLGHSGGGVVQQLARHWRASP